MNEAYKQAQMAFESGEIPVGAVIVAGNRIIAKAFNQVEKLNDCTAHAEMIAITSATSFMGGKYLQDCSMYVTLEPCLMCAGAAYWAQFSKIVYAVSDPKRGFSRITESVLHPKTTVIRGIKEKECADLLNRFFKNLRE